MFKKLFGGSSSKSSTIFKEGASNQEIEKGADIIINGLFELYNKKSTNIGAELSELVKQVEIVYEFGSSRIMPTSNMMTRAVASEDLASFFTAFLTGIIYSIKNDDVKKIYKEKIKQKLSDEGIPNTII